MTTPVRARVAAVDAAWRKTASACGLHVEKQATDESTPTPEDSALHWTQWEATAELAAVTKEQHRAQQLGVAWLLHWILEQNDVQHTEVEVPIDDDGAVWESLQTQVLHAIASKEAENTQEGLGAALEASSSLGSLVALVDADDVAPKLSDSDESTQIIDCRRQREFHGFEPEAPVSGHVDGAISVPLLSVFDDDGHAFLPKNELVDVLQTAGVDPDANVLVISTNVTEAAAVATAFCLAGHAASVSCSMAVLSDDFIASLPRTARESVFQQNELMFATLMGEFDVSPEAPDLTEEEIECKSQVKREYEERLKEAKKSSDSETTQESEDDTEEIVWTDDNGKHFFDMPNPVDKPLFLQISRDIYSMASFVLAPFGFPSLLRERFSRTEVKTRCSALYHDVIEVCSDLIYQHHEVTEGVMARSVHKWVDDQQDADCVQQVRTINDLIDTLYQLPAVVEVPSSYDEDRVLGIADDLFNRMGDAVRAHAAWAFESPSVDNGSHDNSGDWDSEVLRPESWTSMYPSVVYSLGFIPQASTQRKRRLSTLQIKAFIQTIAEAIWDVMGALLLSEIEFQALCEVLSRDGQDRILELKGAAEHALYVMNHSLSHQDVEAASEDEENDVMAEHLMRIRNAQHEGDRAFRSGRYAEACASYAEPFATVPMFHKHVAPLVVARANCCLQLNELDRAKAFAATALRIDAFSCDAYSCLGDVAEKQNGASDAMQHHITAFILDGSRSIEHATAIERVGRVVGRQHARGIFDAMVLRHELPATWLVESYVDSFEHDIDTTICVPLGTDKTLDDDAASAESDLSAADLIYRAIAYKRLGRYRDSQRNIRSAVLRLEEQPIEDAKLHAAALNMHASFLYVAGDVHAALETIGKALEVYPTCVNALVKQGGFFSEIGDSDAADAAFAAALELDANDADVHLHMGQKALVDGAYHEAVQCLRRAMTRSEALAVTHVSYGMALYRGGSIYQALDVYREAAQQFPNAPEVHLFYGEVLSDQGDFAGAMQHFYRAFELSPHCPLAFLNAGRVYVSTNDPSRAIAHFQQALQIDPRCSSAHLDIAQVLFAQGRAQAAYKHFDDAIACCRFLPEVEEACAAREMARMQEHVTDILGVDLRHVMKTHN